jgi:hypothetical protein
MLFRPIWTDMTTRKRRVDALQLFADEAEGDVIVALTAITHRDVDAQDAQLAHALEGARLHLLAAIIFGNRRVDLTLGPVAHHRGGVQLFISQGKIDHKWGSLALEMISRRSDGATVSASRL